MIYLISALGSRLRRLTPSDQHPWEKRAQLSAAHAVFTSDEMLGVQNHTLLNEDDPSTRLFLQKGREIFSTHLDPHIKNRQKLRVLEFGCGAGRLLRQFPEVEVLCGVDVSPTQLSLAKRIEPRAKYFRVRELPIAGLRARDFNFIYSYAVLQHIPDLSTYKASVVEMCRLLMSGGILLIQINCEDFHHGGPNSAYTINLEDLSYHFKGSTLRSIHIQNDWSGVYIGWHLIWKLLKHNGVRVLDFWPHGPARKSRSIWIKGVKV